MKRISVVMNCLILLFILNFSVLYSQKYLDPKGIVESQIEGLIHSQYGAEYICNGYSIIDSLIHYSTIEKNYRREDPYNTLKGCIFFSTCKYNEESDPDTFITGVLKNGQILWDNAPGIKANPGGHLLYSKDINNDGKVDLIFSEPDRESLKIGKGPSLDRLYVLSWDGTKARFISSLDKDGNSVMFGDGGCELIKKKGRKIQEIKAILPNVFLIPNEYRTKTFPVITYKWNGSKYGFWSEKKQSNKKESVNK
jgi:hypothetical protein